MHIIEPQSSEAGQQFLWRDVNARNFYQLCFICWFRNNEIQYNFGVHLKVIVGHDCVYSRTFCVYVLEIIHLSQQRSKVQHQISTLDY